MNERKMLEAAAKAWMYAATMVAAKIGGMK